MIDTKMDSTFVLLYRLVHDPANVANVIGATFCCNKPDSTAIITKVQPVPYVKLAAVN